MKYDKKLKSTKTLAAVGATTLLAFSMYGSSPMGASNSFATAPQKLISGHSQVTSAKGANGTPVASQTDAEATSQIDSFINANPVANATKSADVSDDAGVTAYIYENEKTVVLKGTGHLNAQKYFDFLNQNITNADTYKIIVADALVLPQNSNFLFSAESEHYVNISSSYGTKLPKDTKFDVVLNPNIDTSNVTSMKGIFLNNQGNPNVSHWDTSKVTDLAFAFYGCENANPDVSNWDTNNVTDLEGTFRYLKKGNPDVSNWKTQNVTSMKGTFYSAEIATPNTTNWDTSNVTTMQYMFIYTDNANPDTSNWNTEKVTDMSDMFSSAKAANPDTSNWNTSNVTNMESMFRSAVSAKPNTSNWDTSKVTSFRSLFENAKVATPDTSNWNTSNVRTMQSMFEGAAIANPDTSNWDTSKVSNMSSMFSGAELAQPNTTNWNTENVSDMYAMFQKASSANPDVSKWNTANVDRMNYMFAEATNADPDTSQWNVGNVKDMTRMFYKTTKANPDVSNWDTHSATRIFGMFQEAVKADPHVENWNVSNLEDMMYAFANSGLTESRFDKWTPNGKPYAGSLLAHTSIKNFNLPYDIQGYKESTDYLNSFIGRAFYSNPDMETFTTTLNNFKLFNSFETSGLEVDFARRSNYGLFENGKLVRQYPDTNKFFANSMFDGLPDGVYTFKLTEAANYNPQSQNQKVKVGATVTPEELVANMGELPAGTTVEFENTAGVDTSEAVAGTTAPYTVVIKYPDGSVDKVTGDVTVYKPIPMTPLVPIPPATAKDLSVKQGTPITEDMLKGQIETTGDVQSVATENDSKRW